MTRILCCVAVILCWVSLINAIQPPQPLMLLRTRTPQVVEAQVTGKAGELKFTETRTVYKQEAREKEIVVNGQKQRVTYVVTVPVQMKVTKTVLVDGKNVKAYLPNGKTVDIKTVSKMLKKKTPVVLTYGRPVSSLFRRVLKKNTLNIVLRQPKLPVRPIPPAPRPVPLPAPGTDAPTPAAPETIPVPKRIEK